jgi:hypothetical protein
VISAAIFSRFWQPFVEVYEYFFEDGPPLGPAVIRVAFFSLYLFMLWDLYPNLDLFLGRHGLYNSTHTNLYFADDFKSLLFHFDDPFSLRVWFWTSALLGALGLIGGYSRACAAGVFVSHTLLQGRNPFIVFGADDVLKAIGFWLPFLRMDDRWSIREALRQRRRETAAVPYWPIKAIQIQVVLIYLTGALFKFSNIEWLYGRAVFHVAQDPSTATSLSFFLVRHQEVAMLASYFSVFSELLFPILVFTSFRWHAIILVCVMHLGIDLFMNIRFFALGMDLSYLSFVRPTQWALVVEIWDRSSARIRARWQHA